MFDIVIKIAVVSSLIITTIIMWWIFIDFVILDILEEWRKKRKRNEEH